MLFKRYSVIIIIALLRVGAKNKANKYSTNRHSYLCLLTLFRGTNLKAYHLWQYGLGFICYFTQWLFVFYTSQLLLVVGRFSQSWCWPAISGHYRWVYVFIAVIQFVCILEFSLARYTIFVFKTLLVTRVLFK